MSKRGRLGVWIGAIVLGLAVLGGAGYFGLTKWIEARGVSAVEAVAAFDEAMWANDASMIEELLPSDLVAEMTDDDLQAISEEWREWVVVDSGWDGDVLVVEYESGPDSTGDGTIDVEYKLRSGSSATQAKVRAEYMLSSNGGSDPAVEDARIELVWQDGAWRIARYKLTAVDEIEYVFYAEGEDPEDLLGVLREQFGATGGTASEGGFGVTDMVKAYYEALLSREYDAAFELLPEDKRASFGDAIALRAQMEGYGITGYAITDVVAASDGDSIITAELDTSAGVAVYEWRVTSSGEPYDLQLIDLRTDDAAPILQDDEMVPGELPEGHPDLGGNS